VEWKVRLERREHGECLFGPGVGAGKGLAGERQRVTETSARKARPSDVDGDSLRLLLAGGSLGP